MSNQRKPAPVCELSQILLVKASRARYEAARLATAGIRSHSLYQIDYSAIGHREGYDKAVEVGNSEADCFYAPQVSKALARVVSARTNVGAVIGRAAGAAEDYANLLQALLPRNLQLKDHDPQEAQACAFKWHVKLAEAEKKTEEALYNVHLWEHHLATKAAAKRGEK